MVHPKVPVQPETSGVRTFTIIWFGQLLSLIGSGLSSFALAVWVYQRTGSATEFALISLFATLPFFLLSPIAGVLVDRSDRRWVMLLSDAAAGLSLLAVALLLAAGRLETWQIYLAAAVGSICDAFHWPAYSASVTLLVPKKHLGRASGLLQLGEAASRILAPMLAGALLLVASIQTIIMVDCASFVFAVATLLVVRIPRPAAAVEESGRKRSLLEDVASGWSYVTRRRGLLGLTIYGAAINFQIAIIQVLVTPMVLAFASAAELGTVKAAAGLGMVAGSVLMSIWGGPRRRVLGIFGFALLQGMGIMLAGLRPSTALVAVSAFAGFFCYPIVLGSNRVLWQSKVPPGLQGRVFTMAQTITWVTVPLAYVVAGPLADHVFGPLLAHGGPLAGSLGGLIGVGPGRGIGLLFIVAGALTIFEVLVAFLYPRIRRIETELPDAIPDQAPTTQAETDVAGAVVSV
jgi:MFS transporter, DHA3 family, macrolide efflux protein